MIWFRPISSGIITLLQDLTHNLERITATRGKRRSFNFDTPVEEGGIEGAKEQGKLPGTEGERENCDLGANHGVVRVLHDPVRTAPNQTEIGCRNNTCRPIRTERYNHPKAAELHQDEEREQCDAALCVSRYDQQQAHQPATMEEHEERIVFASEFNAAARDQPR